MPVLSALQVRKFTTLFQHYDRSHSQYLELRDFLSFADHVARLSAWFEHDAHLAQKKLSVLRQSKQDAFFRLLAVADSNQDARISLPEYLEYCRRQSLECKNMGVAAPWIKQSCHDMILLADDNASNTLTLNEYQKWLSAMGSNADAAKVFATLDQDGDGELSLPDLEKLALEFVISDDPNAAGNLLFCGKF